MAGYPLPILRSKEFKINELGWDFQVKCRGVSGELKQEARQVAGLKFSYLKVSRDVKGELFPYCR